MKSKKPSCFRLSHSLWLTANFLLLSASLPAATPLTWDGVTGSSGLQDGGGDWNTTDLNRWWDGSSYVPWANSAVDPVTAIFGNGSGAAGTVTLKEPIVAGGLTFKAAGSGAYTLASSTSNDTLTVLGVSGASPVVTADVAATISAILAGSDGFTKKGADNLTLGGSSANTYTGITYVTEGTLTLNKTANVTAIKGDIVINGGNLGWSQANMVDDNATITMTSGALGLYGKTETIKNLDLQGGSSNLGTSSNGGTFTVTDTLSASGTGTLGTNSGANWSANRVAFSGGARTVLTMTGNTTRISQLTIGTGGLSMTGQTVSLNKGTLATALGTQIILNGDVTTSGANTFSSNGTGGGVARLNIGGNFIAWDVATPTGSEITNVSVAITGTGGITKTGGGVLSYGSADSNGYTGMTTVSEGALRMAKTAGGIAIQGDVTVDGGILDWDQPNNLADTATVYLNAGALKFDNLTETFTDLIQTGGQINHNGDTNSGFVTLLGTLRMSGGSGLSLNSGAQWTVNKADFTGFSGSVVGLNGNSNSRVTRLTIGPGGLVMSGQTISLNIGSSPAALGSDIILNGDVTASGTNNFTAPGSGGGVAQINLGSEIRTWNITSGTTSSSANFVGAGGGVRKTGTGILSLNAAAAYTGKTSVEGGTFRLNNAIAAIDDSPWLEVGGGATFANNTGVAYSYDGVISGSGMLTGDLVVSDSRGAVASVGVIKPGGSTDGDSLASAGDQVGTLTFANDLDLAGASGPGTTRLQLQIRGATGNAADTYAGDISAWVAAIPTQHASLVTGTPGDHDHLQVTGSLTLNAGGEIQVVNEGDAYTPRFGDVFNLIDWSSLTNNGFSEASDLALPGLADPGFAWDTSLFLGYGVVVVVPEPGRISLLALGLAGCLLRRRRCRLT